MVQDRSLADMPGLEGTIREVTRAFRQGLNMPASAILPDMRVSLPVPEWAVFSFVSNVDAVIGAGQAVTVTVLQVAPDERAWLDGFQQERTAGDNNLVAVQITAPLRFGSSPQEMKLLELSTADPIIFWPDPGGVQAIEVGGPQIPVLLEPLTEIEMTTDGSGVAATTFRSRLMLRRMRLTRASAP